MDLLDRINELCEEKGITKKKMESEAGLSTGSTSKWKKGFRPNNASLQKLSSFFGVSIDYLLGNTNDPMPGQRKNQEKPAEETPAVGVVVSRNGLRTSIELKPEDAQMIEELIKKIHASYGEK